MNKEGELRYPLPLSIHFKLIEVIGIYIDLIICGLPYQKPLSYYVVAEFYSGLKCKNSILNGSNQKLTIGFDLAIDVKTEKY